MARNLSKLLGDGSKKIRALNELRLMTGDDLDVRLIADILARAHSIIRSLGLDPRIATAEEIYQALLAIAPRIEQWAPFKSSDWVLINVDDQVISFHPVDIVNNYHHQLPLGQHRSTHGKRGLGFEITRRYKEHPRTHAPAVERVVCDGEICWIDSPNRPTKQTTKKPAKKNPKSRPRKKSKTND